MSRTYYTLYEIWVQRVIKLVLKLTGSSLKEEEVRKDMKTGAHIDYKRLKAINPKATRKAVLEYLKTNNGNIADAARLFGINRPVVYDILRKDKEGDLTDRSKRPKHSPNKTPDEIEDKVIEVKNKTIIQLP